LAILWLKPRSRSFAERFSSLVRYPKVPALRGNSYRLNLGIDKDGKAVEQRVGSDKKFAEAFRKAWNAAIERTDGMAILTELSELARLDVRKALLLLKDYSSIELADCVQFYINHALPESGIITVKNGVERYMEIQKEKNLGEVSTDEKGATYKTYIKPFKDHFGDKPHLIQLTPEKVTAYLVDTEESDLVDKDRGKEEKEVS
jgi:hypothetical protein